MSVSLAKELRTSPLAEMPRYPKSFRIVDFWPRCVRLALLTVTGAFRWTGAFLSLFGKTAGANRCDVEGECRDRAVSEEAALDRDFDGPGLARCRGAVESLRAESPREDLWIHRTPHAGPKSKAAAQAAAERGGKGEGPRES